MVHEIKRRRPLLAAVVGVVALALCAVPIYWTALFAYASFTGCFLGCSKPEPAVAVMWGSLTLLLLIAPFSAAAAVGRYRPRVAVVTIATIVLVLGATLLVSRGAI